MGSSKSQFFFVVFENEDFFKTVGNMFFFSVDRKYY